MEEVRASDNGKTLNCKSRTSLILTWNKYQDNYIYQMYNQVAEMKEIEENPESSQQEKHE